MAKGAVRVKIFLDHHAGVHFGNLHMPAFVYDQFINALAKGNVRLTLSGPYHVTPSGSLTNLPFGMQPPGPWDK